MPWLPQFNATLQQPSPARGNRMRWLIHDRTVNLVVMANAFAVFAMAAVSTDGLAHAILRNIDVACVAYFVVEAVLKVRRDGWSIYAAAGWNRFDLAVTVASLPVLLSPFITLRGWEAIVLLRMARLFRLFRVLRFVPDVDRLAVGLTRATKAGVGVLLALILLNAILGLGATVLFGRFAPEHFGDPLAAMYTVFRVFTMDGWSEIPALVASNANSDAWGLLAKAYFIVAVVAGGMLGMGLANAVLVDEMLADENQDLRELMQNLHTEIAAVRSELRELRAHVAVGPATESLPNPQDR